uniref:poly(ADP-ribose) glycohydrolase n=1 Tax=Aplanochytrium stocchinoi TaxID=215587 RepID=A0A7S3V2G4_9STRA|mmetsp:Transcript_17096/g.20585  ORF Transcript_17096/g.20585 Transcript_17096/m.20585 type:complete len:531 (+) Transcript_17096:71-1663(+)
MICGKEMAKYLFLPHASCNFESFQKLSKLLVSRVKDHNGLASIISQVKNLSSTPALPGLKAAIDKAENTIPNLDFYGRLLPKIQAWALECTKLFPSGKLNQLPSGGTGKVELTRSQVRSILSATFFDVPIGSLSMFSLYNSSNNVGVARIMCQIAYFHQISTENQNILEDEHIIVNRRCSSSFPDWSTLDKPLSAASFSSELRIEESKALSHVDFANAKLHIGRILPSATQEEILFSIKPELFIAVLIADEGMKENESIRIEGARQYSDYSGYLDSFTFLGVKKQCFSPVPDIIAIDALIAKGNNQFEEANMRRDTNKAYLGFFPRIRDDEVDATVSSGNWGSGAFGGDVSLKFVQQLLAASAAGVMLEYSTFQNPSLEKRLKAINDMLQSKTVSQVWKILCSYSPSSENECLIQKIAQYHGSKQVQALKHWNKAIELEELGSFGDSVAQYSRAFRLWPALDSPACDHDNIPREVLLEANACGVPKTLFVTQTDNVVAPYLTGDSESMKNRASNLPVSDFENHLKRCLCA